MKLKGNFLASKRMMREPQQGVLAGSRDKTRLVVLLTNAVSGYFSEQGNICILTSSDSP